MVGFASHHAVYEGRKSANVNGQVSGKMQQPSVVLVLCVNSKSHLSFLIFLMVFKFSPTLPPSRRTGSINYLQLASSADQPPHYYNHCCSTNPLDHITQHSHNTCKSLIFILLQKTTETVTYNARTHVAHTTSAHARTPRCAAVYITYYLVPFY